MPPDETREPQDLEETKLLFQHKLTEMEVAHKQQRERDQETFEREQQKATLEFERTRTKAQEDFQREQEKSKRAGIIAIMSALLGSGGIIATVITHKDPTSITKTAKQSPDLQKDQDQHSAITYFFVPKRGIWKDHTKLNQKGYILKYSIDGKSYKLDLIPIPEIEVLSDEIKFKCNIPIIANKITYLKYAQVLAVGDNLKTKSYSFNELHIASVLSKQDSVEETHPTTKEELNYVQ